MELNGLIIFKQSKQKPENVSDYLINIRAWQLTLAMPPLNSLKFPK